MISNFLLSFIATLACSVLFNIKGKKIIFCALGGGLGWVFYYLSINLIKCSNIFAFFIGALIVSIYSEVMARILKAPVTLFVICGIMPLVPGSGMYYTMLESIQGNTTKALELGINTLSIAGAIAVSILLISSIARMMLFYNKKNNSNL